MTGVIVLMVVASLALLVFVIGAVGVEQEYEARSVQHQKDLQAIREGRCPGCSACGKAGL